MCRVVRALVSSDSICHYRKTPSRRRPVCLLYQREWPMSHQFQVRLRRRNIGEEELLADMRRCAQELSKDTLTRVEYDQLGCFGATTLVRRFKQWNLALAKAGLSTPNRQNVSEVELFENLATAWTSLGRQPYGRDMDKAGGISVFALGTYEKRFGSWNNALLAFETFIQQGKVSDAGPHPQKKSQSAKRTARKINWRLRALVLIRDNCICQMCGASPAKDSSVVLHADHIKPWSKGGETVLENLRTLCEKCNVGKSDFYDGAS